MEQPLAREDARVVGPSRVTSGANWIDWLRDVHIPLWLVSQDQAVKIVPATTTDVPDLEDDEQITGYVPAADPARLGDPQFCQDYGLTYPYISGAMANGIGSVDIAVAMGKASMLGIFGAAGLSPEVIAQSVDRLQAELGERPFGVNLIHAPQEPAWEERVVDLLIEKNVTLVEASAYLQLTPAVVRYRLHGIHEDAFGRIITPNRVLAKISRIEVARKFLEPAPQKMLDQLVAQGHLTEAQARLARQVPMASDLTAEADSGGHTDNRPAVALLPTIMALRDAVVQAQGYPFPIRVGLAGGISTPASAAAAFAMGAAFVLVGSVNQACVESGSSDVVRRMLAEAEQADIAMAPAADMFEMGVNLQVLKRGTMFPMRAKRLYQLYTQHKSWAEIPAKDRANLEKTVFRASFDEIWRECEAFFQQRDPRQLERAARDAKHQMALVFRWYLGKSSNWANRGVADRKVDYQVWCGPAMGAFNEWVKGTFLAKPEARGVVVVAQNILYGAALLQRVQSARGQGLPLDPPPLHPQTLQSLKEFFR